MSTIMTANVGAVDAHVLCSFDTRNSLTTTGLQFKLDPANVTIPSMVVKSM